MSDVDTFSGYGWCLTRGGEIVREGNVFNDLPLLFSCEEHAKIAITHTRVGNIYYEDKPEKVRILVSRLKKEGK